MKWQLLFSVFLALMVALPMHAQEKSDPIDAVHAEISKTLGIVPTFMQQYPDYLIKDAWSEFKTVVLSPSAIQPKYKELIGLGVASQIPCHYCTYFHTQFAQLHNATAEEIQDAVASAAGVRKWSTVLNGMQINYGDFKKDIMKLVTGMKKNKSNTKASVVTYTDANSVYKDLNSKYGVVPEFIRQYPQDSLPVAWTNLTALDMGSAILPAKIKNLISIAVSSQVPCEYCVFTTTEFAKFNGASQKEIKEAILLGAIVRQWSTVLNGMQIDEEQFKNEVNQIITHSKEQMKLSE